MRFALVDGQRHRPEKGLKGICPVCNSPVTARCGEIRAHHWAHSRGTDCADTWCTGKETDWHLDWKNEFPDNWQECILRDATTGEKHIADVLTDKNLVVEFQHSPIAPDERRAREAFYTKEGRRMVWVVDITNSKNALKRIKKYFDSLTPKPELNRWYQIPFPEEVFPAQWKNKTNILVPVIFDCGYEFCLYDRNGEVFPAMPILFASVDIWDGMVLWILRKQFVKLVHQSRLHDEIFKLLMLKPRESKAATSKKDMANKQQTSPIRDGKIPGTSIIRRSTPGYRRKMRRF